MNENSTDFEERETSRPEETSAPLNAKSLRIFAKMVKDYHHGLQRYVRTLCQDEALCNDLVQDTFLSAQQQIDKGIYSETGRALSWLCSIARNHLMDHYRQHSRCHMHLSLNYTQICDNLGWSSEGLGESATATMLESGVVSAPEKRRKRISENMGVLMKTRFKVLSLSEEERELLCLRYCDEQVFREVSERNGEPLSTVISRYYAVLKKVRKQLLDLEAQGLFEKELSVAQMHAYIRKRAEAAARAEETDREARMREARQRDRMRKIVAYARRNHRRDDPEESVVETVC